MAHGIIAECVNLFCTVSIKMYAFMSLNYGLPFIRDGKDVFLHLILCQFRILLLLF